MSTNTPDLTTDPAVAGLQPTRERLREVTAGMVIRTADQYEAAATLLKTIQGALATIEDSRTRITRPLNDALKAVNAQARDAATPFLEDERIIKAALVTYSTEQERIRQEEQRRQNEIAEKERRRLQAIADEAARKAAEEAARKRAEAKAAAAAGRAEEAAKLAAQAQLVEEKAAEKVEKFETRAAAVVAPIAQQAAPKVAAVNLQTVWNWEITDTALIPREYLLPDLVKIRKVVNALKGDTAIAGIRVYSDKRVAAGSA